MRKSRIITVVLVAAAVVAMSATTTWASSTIGQASPAPTNSGGSCVSATSCTFFQGADGGSPSYAVPSDGVITSYSLGEGNNLSGINSVRLRVFRGGPPWLVAGESSVTPLPVGCCGPAQRLLPAHVSVKAGDRIGVTVHYSGDTAWQVAGGPSDTVLMVNGVAPSVGDVLVPLNLIATGNVRLNLGATIEPDADGDGLGDETQDLCPNNPLRGQNGCSGTTLGTTFTLPMSSNSGCSPTNTCMLVNTSVLGQSTASPSNGVIVRWRVRPVGTTQHSLYVLAPIGGGTYRTAAISDPISVDGGSPPIVTSGEVRIPIAAGSLIGDTTPPAGNYGSFFGEDAGDEGIANPAPTLGATTSPFVPTSKVAILYNADVEPDVDGDDYGDETQDSCPKDPAYQSACPTPHIAGMRIGPKEFRVDRKGAAVSRARKGSSVSFSLDIPATVAFKLSRATSGRRQGKLCRRPTRKNRHKHRCTRYTTVTTFAKSFATAGAEKFAFSGRYKKGSKTKSLTPGKYRLTAGATSVAGLQSTAKSASFKIVRR